MGGVPECCFTGGECGVQVLARIFGMTPRVAMPWAGVSGAATLLEKLFLHARRDAETSGHFLARAVAVIRGGLDAGGQIERTGSHFQIQPHPECGCSFA